MNLLKIASAWKFFDIYSLKLLKFGIRPVFDKGSYEATNRMFVRRQAWQIQEILVFGIENPVR